ncbi:MAG: PAS domain-containing protein, partial [Muribaculaceae bacterium]|nr:PAS domain-containing protein [Muribaculaceae bacterium]
MKSKIYFLLLCLAVIAPTVVLGLATQRPEVAVCCLLPETALLILVYRMLFRPMRVIATGLELLREQDFSSRLRIVGQPDADRVVDMFNSMMACLHRQNLQIREQNEFLDLLIDASPMGVIILDDNDNICQLNGAACEMLATGAGAQPLSALTSPLALALRRL